jgi:hypothetical protein
MTSSLHLSALERAPSVNSSRLSGRIFPTAIPSIAHIDSSVTAICDRIEQGQSVDVEPSQIPAVVDCLRNHQKAILESPDDSTFDYSLLQRIDDSIATLLESSERTAYSGVHKAELDTIQDRLQRSHQTLTERENEFDFVRDDFNARRQADADRLRGEQETEFAALVQTYSQELPLKFRRCSPELVNVRIQEKKARLTHRFVEAKALKMEGDTLEAKEMEQNRLMWRREFEIASAAMRKKHRKQMNCLNEKWDREWTAIEPSARSEQGRVKMVIEAAERRMDEVQRSRNDFVLTTTRNVQNARKSMRPVITARHAPRSTLGRRGKIGEASVRGSPRRLIDVYTV